MSSTAAIDVATHEKGFGQMQLNKSNQQDLLQQADQYDYSSLVIELRGIFIFFVIYIISLIMKEYAMLREINMRLFR